MILQSLRLRNFRNYEDATFTFSPRMNLITGNNAQGKTNLLESMVFLSLTRSNRVNDHRLLIKKDAPFGMVACDISDGSRSISLEAILHGDGKTLRVQGHPVKQSSEFIGLLNVVLFSPDELRLFKDQPSERRRLLDQEIAKISPSYLNSLNQYQRLLKERNQLLKMPNVDRLFLETLNDRMILEQKTVIEKRQEFVEFIDARIAGIYRRVAGDLSEVRVKYHSCIKSLENTLENLKEMYEASLASDIEHKHTSRGIHREDLVFSIGGENVVNVASQGQKRMVMLSFKAALLEYIKQQTHSYPVLLLDDVLSELDEAKQNRLLDLVQKPCQCMITSTKIPPYANKDETKVFVIENGKVAHGG